VNESNYEAVVVAQEMIALGIPAQQSRGRRVERAVIDGDWDVQEQVADGVPDGETLSVGVEKDATVACVDGIDILKLEDERPHGGHREKGGDNISLY
jgi:hypothetical protein